MRLLICLITFGFSVEVLAAELTPKIVHDTEVTIVDRVYSAPDGSFRLAVPHLYEDGCVYVREETHKGEFVDIKFLADNGTIFSITHGPVPQGMDRNAALDRIAAKYANTEFGPDLVMEQSAAQGETAPARFTPSVQFTLKNEHRGSLRYPYAESQYRGDALNSIGCHKFFVHYGLAYTVIHTCPTRPDESLNQARDRAKRELDLFLAGLSLQ